jgi:hypothetical protein
MLALYFSYKTIKRKLVHKLQIMIGFSILISFINTIVRTLTMIEPSTNPQVPFPSTP